MFAITGGDGAPAKMGTSIADLSAGLYVFGAIMAALRGRTGPAAVPGRRGHVRLGDVAARGRRAALPGPRHRAAAARQRAPLDLAVRHVRLRGRADRGLRGQRRALRRALHGARPPAARRRPRFTDNGSRSTTGTRWRAELEVALAGAPAAEWLDRLSAAGVPCSPVGRVGEALDSAQAAARRMVVTSGGLPMPGNPMKISAYPDPADRPGPARGLDQRGPAGPGRARGLPAYSVNFSCAAIAAPTMPALLSSWAGFTGVRTSSSGTHLSAFLLTPPPSTNRSGVNSFSTCRR